MIHHPGRVSIIGAGTLGGTIAYSLMMAKIAQEILLVDLSINIVQGQVLDLSEAAANTGVVIRAGTFKEAGQSSVIIVTADAQSLPNESRSEWLMRSRRLFLSIASSLSPVPKDTLIVITSDPVDLYVQFFQSYFPHVPTDRIFGIGTTMATERFRTWIGDMTDCQDCITDAYCIGTQKTPIVVWNHAKFKSNSISTLPLLVAERARLETIVSEHRSNLIRERKGRAWYGTAAVMTRLTKALLCPHLPSVIWVLSVHVPRLDSCISWPVILGTTGIQSLVQLPLDEIESAKVMKVVESNTMDFQTSMGRT
ncbi:hypothetical protein INT47_002423 [Mucor saturninus]|uniref:L-lactate dehydrogenase n=1 Tax=Mucor saturninus TaxID=64648 RepID=A0A8H7RIW9_9FUNG|nr:hypothetical protein INT47_002423 [Mucor saturninus]